MIILETVAVAFSMYSAIPVPQLKWTQRNMKYALCAFPLIGVVIGLVCWGISAVCYALELPAIFRAALLCAAPVILTGGIHLDGYADTCDALASHGERLKKLEILKDPHVGSFAVIRLCCHFTVMLAAWAALRQFSALPMIISFVLSRTLSALAVAAFPMAKKDGLAYTFARAMERRKVVRALICVDIILCIILCLCGWTGVVMAVAAHAVFIYYFFMSHRTFGGITGDLAGWFLIQAEKWMLLAAVILGYLS